MAAIDKIYLNSYEEYLQFKEWCEKQPLLTDKYGVKEKITRYLYLYDKPFVSDHAVFNAPYYVDAYVIRNCPFNFIQNAIMINYGHRNQSSIDEAYRVVTERELGIDSDFYTWLTSDDFKIVDGKVTYPANENSDYMKIKRGELYTSPSEIKYEIGKHFKCIRHPSIKYNTPFKGNWFISIETPKELPYLWYHQEHNSWDFMDDYVICNWSSSTAFCRTIKALKRLILKWKLPVGSKVHALGRYTNEIYEFIIKK